MYSKASFDFRGCVALVTGGVGGIGSAIASQLSQSGATVVVWDRIEGDDPRLRYDIVDVTDGGSIDRALERMLARHGKLDFVINNAGFSGRTLPLEAYEPAEWKHIVDVNLVGLYEVCRAVIPAMRGAGQGRIVNIASLAGKEGTANFSAYSAARAGVIAHQVGRQGTRADRRAGQRHRAGGRADRAARPDESGPRGDHGQQKPDGAAGRKRRSGGAGRLAVFRLLHLQHRRGVRSLGRPRHLLTLAGESSAGCRWRAGPSPQRTFAPRRTAFTGGDFASLPPPAARSRRWKVGQAKWSGAGHTAA